MGASSDAKGNNIAPTVIDWTFEAETKLPPFRKQHFQIHFPEWKCMNSA